MNAYLKLSALVVMLALAAPVSAQTIILDPRTGTLQWILPTAPEAAVHQSTQVPTIQDWMRSGWDSQQQQTLQSIDRSLKTIAKEARREPELTPLQQYTAQKWREYYEGFGKR